MQAPFKIEAENLYYTNGGPFICAPQSVMWHWGGADKLSEPDAGSGFKTDYARACRYHHWPNVLTVGGLEAFVLHIPGGLSVIQSDSSLYLADVQVFDDEANALIINVQGVEFERRFDIYFADEPYYIWDAAFPGPEAKIMTDIAEDEPKMISMQAGWHTVEIGTVNCALANPALDDDDFSKLILCRITPLAPKDYELYETEF